MIFFEKPIYKYQNMPFILDEFTDCTPDDEKCLIDIEAYGNIDGQMKYCYSSFSLKKPEMYENGDREAEQIINPVVEILSISIGNFCTVFDPKRLIIFSDMFYFGRFYVKMVKEINEQRGSAETVFIKDGGELQKFSAASLAVGNFLASGGK